MNKKKQEKALKNSGLQKLEYINNHSLSYLYSQLNLQFEALNNSLIAFKACLPKYFSAHLNPKVILGNPIGELNTFKNLLKQFTNKNKHCFFLHIHQYAYKPLKQLKFKHVFIGNQHCIRLDKTKPLKMLSKRLKKNCQRAQKQGLLIKEIDPQTLDPKWLKTIKSTWLSQKKGPKTVHSFINMPLINDALHTRCFAAYLEKQIISIRMFSPLYQNGHCVGYTANSCYYNKQCPQGCQAYLIYRAAQQFQSEGYLYLNLGLSPLDQLLSKKKPRSQRFFKPQNVLLKPLKMILNPIYNLDGLYMFKRQFKAKKIPTYIAYNSILALLSGFFILLWIYLGSENRSKPV